jgi:2-oxoisovalerate dehydrogenase E2 component (dihydrolipoyl transacylase)
MPAAAIAPLAGPRRRADQGHRHAPSHRREYGGVEAAIPHFTYVDEIDVTKLEELRADLNATRGSKPKLTMLPLMIVAICKAIPDFPMINARYDDEAGVVTRYGAIHLGMATQTDAGLMVPVIRDAQDRNVWQLATEIVRLADAARTGKAKLEPNCRARP